MDAMKRVAPNSGRQINPIFRRRILANSLPAIGKSIAPETESPIP